MQRGESHILHMHDIDTHFVVDGMEKMDDGHYLRSGEPCYYQLAAFYLWAILLPSVARFLSKLKYEKNG